MSLKTWLALSTPYVLGLALCASAMAQDAKRDRDNKGDRKTAETQTVRGVIAGVTVEGEVAIDYRNRRAVEAVATLLTVVGSPTPDAKEDKASADRDKDKDGDKAKAGHHRHNLYVLELSPRTQVRDTRKGDAKDKNGAVSSIDALEIGERLDVKFTPRDEDKSAGDANQAHRAKHGRHRTYFGDAMTITILPQSTHDGQDPSARGDGSKDKDKK